MKKLIGKVLVRIPFIRYAYLYKYNSDFRPGHYYSPVADRDDLRARQDAIWAPNSLPGINLNEEVQKEHLSFLLNNEKSFEIPKEKQSSRRYFGDAPSYPYVDGVSLYSMMVKYKPKNVIEVGSGFSSVCMLDASEQHRMGTAFTFVEPYPQWCLDKVLPQEDLKRHSIELITKRVQDVPPSVFKKLQANDILFIDSSHVSKPGSDVNYLLTQVLPVLNKGVIIHFHDIFYPFEYTKEYLLELKLLWSEAYSLHNFLLFNNEFRILFFSDYMKLKLGEDASFAAEFPQSKSSLFYTHPVRPKNIWIQRV